MRIALGIEYNGADFFGWQKQSDRPSVQEAVEQALYKFIGQKINVYVAGRTDTGVHALEQVIHFDTDIVREDFSWVRGMNTFLRKNQKKTISILWAKQVDETFHARFSAIARTYYYILYVGKTSPACFDGQVGYYMHSGTLDVDAMQEGANFLIGRHDFSSFRASICQAKTPIKTMYNIKIQSNDCWYLFEIKANAFLHHMVRNIMGCLITIGANKKPVEWMNQVLLAKSRISAAPTFMACGLYLANIDYQDINLPQTKPKLPWCLNLIP